MLSKKGWGKSKLFIFIILVSLIILTVKATDPFSATVIQNNSTIDILDAISEEDGVFSVPISSDDVVLFNSLIGFDGRIKLHLKSENPAYINISGDNGFIIQTGIILGETIVYLDLEPTNTLQLTISEYSPAQCEEECSVECLINPFEGCEEECTSMCNPYSIDTNLPFTISIDYITIPSIRLESEIFDEQTAGSSFDNGVYNQTHYNAANDGVELNSSTTGTYTSEIFNAQGTTTWSNITFTTPQPYGINIPSTTEEPGVNTSNLVLLYNMDEDVQGSGTQILDSSTSSQNGTLRGNVNCTVNGILGKGCYFDGNGDYIALQSFYNTQGQISTMTACAWFNTDYSGSLWYDNWALLDYDRSEFFNLYIRGDNGRLSFATTDSAGITDDMDGITATNDGSWHLACAVYDGTDKIIYLDGIENARDINPHSGRNLGDSITRYGMIGDGSEATAFDGTRNLIYYTGYIDEVALWHRDLSDDELLGLYKRGALKLNSSVRVCSDSNCSSATWQNLGLSTYYNLSLNESQFFQYKVQFDTIDSSYTPLLQNISIMTSNTAPTAVLRTPINGSYFNTNITINISVSDQDLNNITLYIYNTSLLYSATDQNGSDITYFWNISKEGTMDWYYFISDGMMNSTIFYHQFITDFTKPSLSLNPSSLSEQNTTSSEVLINVSISDTNLDTIKLFWNNVSEDFESTLNSDYFSTKSVSSGTYEYYIFSNDTAGNTNITAVQTFICDNQQPTVTIATPLVGSSYIQNDNILLTAYVTDDINLSTVTANVTLPDLSVITVTLTDPDLDDIFSVQFENTSQIGSYTLRITATDKLSNSNTEKTRSFSIQDNDYPLVNLLSPLDQAIITLSSVNLTCNVSDNSIVSNVSFYTNLSGAYELNNTITVNSATNVTTYELSSISDGVYSWNCRATDSTGKQTYGNANLTFRIDTTIPTINNYSPNGSTFNISSTIEVLFNTSDDFGIDQTYANITYPNSTIITLNFNTSTNFTIPDLIGTYSVYFFSNDTSGNINNITTSFTAADVSNPVISAYSCTPSPILNQTVLCNLTVTDDILIDTVAVNVLYPNSSQFSYTITNNDPVYSFTVNQTDVIGSHSVTWTINDSSSNSVQVADSFTISDIYAPTITINTDNTNTSDTTITLNFSVTDNYDQNPDCTIYYGSDSVSSTGLTTINNLEEGVYNWNVSCTDSSNNQNISTNGQFIIDTSTPTFQSLQTWPSSADDIDPDTNITIIVSLLDNLTSVHTVNVEYKLQSDDDYSTLSSIVAGYNLFNATLNVNVSGDYHIRVFANDSMGNSDTSNPVNLSIELDNSWTISPKLFDPINTNSTINVTLGNLTINNTGDYAINITIGSDSNKTIFGSDTNFTLQPKNFTLIQISDQSLLGGVKTVTLTVNSTGSPSTQTSVGRIVAVPGKPVLLVQFTDPTTESITLSSGTALQEFAATITNIGSATAENVSLSVNFPSDWNLLLGSINKTVGNLTPSASDEIIIGVEIPSTAPTGTFNITINASGIFNNTNMDDLIFSDSVEVIVSQGIGIQSSSSPGTSGTSTPVSSSSSGSSSGSGGGSAAAISDYIDKVITGEEILNTEETVNLVRGGNNTFSIGVKNIFKDLNLTDISISIRGYLSDYISIDKIKIPYIKYGDKEEFIATVTSPEYMEKEVYTLTVIISGKIIGDGINKDFLETRKISLNIQTVDIVIAHGAVADAEAMVQEMIDAGFKVGRVQGFLSTGKLALESGDYDTAITLCNEIQGVRDLAFEAHSMIADIESKLNETAGSKIAGYVVLKKYQGSMELLGFAKAAFNRGDYETAIERLKQLELGTLLEQQSFNLTYFVFQYWWAIIFITIIIATSGVTSYHIAQKKTISNKVRGLLVEEEVVRGLMKKTQKQYYRDNKISPSKFDITMSQYYDRIHRIRQKRTELRNKRRKIIAGYHIIADLDNERKDIIEYIQTLQTNYFVNRKISQTDYLDDLKIYHERLAEIEEEHILVEINNRK